MATIGQCPHHVACQMLLFMSILIAKPRHSSVFKIPTGCCNETLRLTCGQGEVVGAFLVAGQGSCTLQPSDFSSQCCYEADHCQIDWTELAELHLNFAIRRCLWKKRQCAMILRSPTIIGCGSIGKGQSYLAALDFTCVNSTRIYQCVAPPSIHQHLAMPAGFITTPGYPRDMSNDYLGCQLESVFPTTVSVSVVIHRLDVERQSDTGRCQDELYLVALDRPRTTHGPYCQAKPNRPLTVSMQGLGFIVRFSRNPTFLPNRHMGFLLQYNVTEINEIDVINLASAETPLAANVTHDVISNTTDVIDNNTRSLSPIFLSMGVLLGLLAAADILLIILHCRRSRKNERTLAHGRSPSPDSKEEATIGMLAR